FGDSPSLPSRTRPKKSPSGRTPEGRFEIRSEPSRCATNGDDGGRNGAEVSKNRLYGGFHVRERTRSDRPRLSNVELQFRNGRPRGRRRTNPFLRCWLRLALQPWRHV